MHDEASELKSPATITREELYVQVWATPMNRLALQYGISGNGLAKICRKLNIPYPPRGYWAKKATGKKVKTKDLPVANTTTPKQALIRPTPRKPTYPALPPELKKKIDVARASAMSINVPDRLVRPHPIIANWLTDYKHRKQRAQLERDPTYRRLSMPDPFTAADHQRHRIFNALFKILERQGCAIEQGEKQKLFVVLEGEKIEFQLRDKFKQVRRPLTTEEKRWRFSSEKTWKQELQPTGKLIFVIKAYLPTGIRTEWLETTEAAIEEYLPDIVASFIAAGSLLAEKTRRRLEYERQCRIAEQKQYEQERIRKCDDNRWRYFVETAHQWQSIETARRFLTNLKELEIDLGREVEGRPLGEWFAWAEQKLQSEDPLKKGGPGIFRSVASVSEWTYKS